MGITVFALLLATQISFLLLPAPLVWLVPYILRPLAYAAALSAVWVFNGVDKRPIRKKRLSVLLAGFGVLIYCAGLLLTGFVAGFAHNGAASDLFVSVHQLWIHGAVIVTAEILRHKLIKGTPAHRRNAIAVILTLVYTIAQLDAMRGFITGGGAGAADFIFGCVLPALALNVLLTRVAYDGALPALMLLRAVYSLTPVFMPVLPNVNVVTWAVIACAMLFVTVILYHCNIVAQSGISALTAKRQAKYQKQSALLQIVTIAAAILLIAFNLRVFPYYPAVVLTDSMSGSINAGSMVLIEKLNTENETLGQGDVILFKRGDMEVLHRVIEIEQNAAGERVYITKGDANENADAALVEQWQVLGISRLGVRYLGYPVVWLKTFLN